MRNIAQYLRKKPRPVPREVFFCGDCDLKKGWGVCYEYGFADSNNTGEKVTDSYGFRANAVMLPRSATVKRFAGVVAQDYNGRQGGQPIKIYEPGSDCDIKSCVTTTCGSTALQCQYDAATVAGTAANAVISGRTVTLTGGLYSTYLVAGDVMFITAGTGVTPGGYTIASVDSATQITLENEPGDYAGSGVGDLAYVLITMPVDAAITGSGLFDTATGYGKSSAICLQSVTYSSDPVDVFAHLETGNDDTGCIAQS